MIEVNSFAELRTTVPAKTAIWRSCAAIILTPPSVAAVISPALSVPRPPMTAVRWRSAMAFTGNA